MVEWWNGCLIWLYTIFSSHFDIRSVIYWILDLTSFGLGYSSADYQQPFWERTLEEKWEFSTDLSNYERQEAEGRFARILPQISQISTSGPGQRTRDIIIGIKRINMEG